MIFSKSRRGYLVVVLLLILAALQYYFVSRDWVSPSEQPPDGGGFPELLQSSATIAVSQECGRLL